MPKNANKIMNITILYQERFDLKQVFTSILSSAHKGTIEKSQDINGIFYEYSLEYFEKINYKEQIINNEWCRVYPSKV